MKRFLLLMLLLLTMKTLSFAGVNFPITILDDKTINIAFVDSDGNDFSVTTYTFEAFLFNNRTDSTANAVQSWDNDDFTISGNDASFTITDVQNNRSEGIDYLECNMYDSSSNRTKVFFARIQYILAESGNSTALSTTVGSTDLTVTITHASGAGSVASVMTAKGDLIVGTGSSSYEILTVGANGQSLVADSTQTGGVKWTTPAGSGDVVGPSAATDNAIARFNLTTGKAIQNSTVTIDDNGTINVPSGQYYNVNGSPITITANQVTDFDSAVTANAEVIANTAKVTNATHTGEVTGSGALTVADNIIDEANLKLESGPTNDYVLTADSTKSGGMKWAAAAGGFTSFTASANAGTPQTISNGNTLYFFGENGINTTANATDQINIGLNNTYLSNIGLNNTHRTSTGADHTYLDQSVVSGATPTFTGTNFTGIPNGGLSSGVGIADNNFLTVDQISPVDNDYAKFTASGIEGRSYAEVKTDLSLNNVENTAVSTWAGSTNLTTLGTIGTGVWNGTALTDAYIANDITIQTTSAMTGTNANFSGTVTANSLIGTVGTATQATIDHDSLANFASNEHFTQANITTVGTIGTGTWQGTAIADTYVANDLTISGGTIDNSAIGASTASTAVFTSVTVNTQLKNVNLTISNDDITSADTISADEQIYTAGTDNDPTTKNITIDFNTGESHTYDLESAGDDIDITLSNIVTGNSYLVEFIQGSVARQINSVTPTIKWLDNTTPTINTTADRSTIIGIHKTQAGTLIGNGADYY